ncbi:MAG: xylulokinase [Acidimicrobiales bacterium]
MAHAIGIDVGTTNTKVVLVSEDGALVAAASRSIPMTRSGPAAEQDAEALWAAVEGALSELTAAHPGRAADVRAIGTCSQYSSIVAVDGGGRPTAPMRLYLDTRGTDRAMAVLRDHPDAFATWIEHHGIPPIGGGLSLAHILHLQQDRPAVHEATDAYLEPMDFVNLRLTGRVTATQCTMFAGQLCDNRSLGATTYDAELVAMAGVDATRLPPLVSPDAVIAPVLPDLAARLGLRNDTVVIAGMNDTHAGAFATGAFGDGRGGLVIGTTAVLLETVDHLAVDLDHEVLSMPSPVAGRYLVCAENGMAGKSVEHVLGELLRPEDALAAAGGTVDPFASLDAVLAASEPGAGGAMFLPWLAGSMAPRGDATMRGGFVNLSLDTRRIDLVRAAVEGTAHNLAWLLPAVEAFTGRRNQVVVFGGGAARSAGWAQVVADVLGVTIRTLRHPAHANARAVALVARRRAEGRTAADLGDLVEVEATYEPDTAAHRLHAARQAPFEAAFDALRPIVAALHPPPEDG